MAESKRSRSLTESGKEHYQSKVEQYTSQLEQCKETIYTVISDIKENPIQSLGDATQIKKDLSAMINKYENLSSEYQNFLILQRTKDSAIDEESRNSEYLIVRGEYTQILDRLEQVMPEKSRSASRHSNLSSVSKSTSRHSKLSSVSKCSSTYSSASKQSRISAVLAEHTAMLAEAKVRMKYAEKEADLLRREAEVKAERTRMEVKRELDAAKSGLDAIQKVLNSEEITSVSQTELMPIATHNKNAFISKGVQSSKPINTEHFHLNPLARSFVPPRSTPEVVNANTQCTPNDNIRSNQQNSGNAEILKFIVKKDLIPSRLTKYDDDPITYLSWKMTFKNVCNEFGTSPTEELELLLRWLGPSSTKQANSIRVCNANDPALAVQKVWQRLEQRYGAPEIIESTLKRRIEHFPSITNKENKRLYELLDLVTEIASVKGQSQYATLFAYYDSSTGINPIISKLPTNIQDKWSGEATKYIHREKVVYPPFSCFIDFLQRITEIKNNPSFQFNGYDAHNTKVDKSSPPLRQNRNTALPRGTTVSSRKTELTLQEETTDSNVLCPYHKIFKRPLPHSLNECNVFRRKPLEDRNTFVRENGICFKCCGEKKHRAKHCKVTIKCDICSSGSHPTALHETKEPDVTDDNNTKVKAACTQVCRSEKGTSKSCAKILPVTVYPRDKPELSHTMYALIDDQSSHSLATSSFFEMFHETGPQHAYTLVSCSGMKPTCGKRAVGYIVESMDRSCALALPSLLECNDIPNNRDEIPSPRTAEQFAHLKDIAPMIPPINNEIDIEILIGRDLISAHHVLDQRTGEDYHPLGQKLPLGWVIIGETCMDKIHISESVNVNKTFLMENGRPSYFQPCDNILSVNPFHKTQHDEKIGLSLEDRTFLQIMDGDFEKGHDGKWIAPLPFRRNRPQLPNNKPQADKRAKSFDFSLLRNPIKRKHVEEFMQNIFDRGHAEIAPPIPPDRERWYLPMFGIYHPKKPNSIRIVFDSSAKHNSLSLNDTLLKGPDLSNSLQGILMRFRREKIAITADVEQMFHNFRVREDHRDFLRFLWHPNHEIEKPLEEFRMTVHIFGNSPSPAVATYGLRKSVEHADPDVRTFVNRDFYVDDGVTSVSTEAEAVDLMLRTQQSLKDGGQLRLHKIASNSKSVLAKFDNEDLAKDLKNLDFGQDTLPVQRSLGMSWDIQEDCFTFQISNAHKPFTRRGVLSVINSLFDPLGFTAPVTLQGKLLLRGMMAESKCVDWDEPLSDSFHVQWETWVKSLHYLQDLQIPRMYCELSVAHCSRMEVHTFSDASKEAIAAVAFLKLFDVNKGTRISFALGKSKVAPSHGHTIPRLELCAAVLAIDVAETVKNQLDVPIENFYFHSDSKVVLGYITNETRRFHVYVTNRVSRIRSFCSPEHWFHVATENNPADIATRRINITDIFQSIWIRGPDFLHSNQSTETSDQEQIFPLVDEDTDPEVRKEIRCSKIRVESALGCHRFSRFSKWTCLVRAVKRLTQFARSISENPTPVENVDSTETFIIKQVQRESFPEEIQAITEGRSPPKDSSLLPLNPIIDSQGILRVGGRISKYMESVTYSQALENVRHPVLIPKGHHIAILLIRHYHDSVHHQGRRITEGAIRTSSYWIIGAKRLIASQLRKCVTCRKLRGQFGWVQMADLPQDRIEPGPPFTFVGLDTFGPWSVISRKTRGGLSNHNRWAILFTCMVSRAVHIELIEELTSSSFINALRRFTAIRGPVKQFRSDRGTNFIGATKELNIRIELVEDKAVQNYLDENKITWIFNPPHASHFGGTWERMIGSCRRILDAIILSYKQGLSHEVLSTFMLEVCAILNARPLLPVSSDPESPEILTPALLLNQKQFSADLKVPIFGSKDAIRSQWKCVQFLVDAFWAQWRREYLHYLQTRQKWEFGGMEFKKDDMVLMKDEDLPRNRWPIGIVQNAYKSDDSKVRKVQVCVIRGDKRASYVRPVSQLVKLLD